MDTKIQILGWGVKGLRCPDYEVNFENEQGEINPITLIQMPNGTGKTTTLELLRATLAGNAITDKWDYRKIKEFQKNEEDIEGEFKISFKCNEKIVTIRLKIDFIENRIHFFTTLGVGQEKGFNLPRECWEYFREDFIKYFIFDGELAKHLLNSEYTDAGDLISILYRLKYLEQIKNKIQKYWESKTLETGIKHEKGITQRKNTVEKLRNKINEYKEKKSKYTEKYDLKKGELEKIKKKYESRLEEDRKYKQEYEQKLKKCAEAKAKVQELTNNILVENRSAYKLCKIVGREVLEFKESLDKVKLPENTAKEFFEELAQEEICICGRRLDDHHKSQIRLRASMYMGQDEMGLLNIIKSQISEVIGEDIKYHEDKYRQVIDEYKMAIDKRMQSNTELEEIKQLMKMDDDELQKADANISALEESLRQLESELDKYEIGGEYDIEEYERRLYEAEDKYAEVAQVLEIKKKTEKITAILDVIIKEARETIVSTIKSDTNILLKKVLPDNDILLDDLDKALKLKGKASGSEGETLSVGYAFLATLYHNTERQLPFIVDSPANSIDLEVRKRVAELVPKLADQFIAFTISSEREGFVTKISEQKGKKVQYITIFRKGNNELEEMARKYEGVKESVDGIKVENKEFFYNFHVNKEDRDV